MLRVQRQEGIGAVIIALLDAGADYEIDTRKMAIPAALAEYFRRHVLNPGSRREMFYWLTVMATFALGTAAGDMAAFTLNLGFFSAGLIFAVLIALVAVLHYAAKGWLSEHHERQTRNTVLAFWAAYILTRPLGASFADWFGKSPSIGGLGWGDGTVSLILTVILVGFVWYLAVTRVDVDRTHV
ncbi:MAG: hypothetical protein ACREGH_01090 [Minisyncoccia bacterium]